MNGYCAWDAIFYARDFIHPNLFIAADSQVNYSEFTLE